MICGDTHNLANQALGWQLPLSQKLSRGLKTVGAGEARTHNGRSRKNQRTLEPRGMTDTMDHSARDQSLDESSWLPRWCPVWLAVGLLLVALVGVTFGPIVSYGFLTYDDDVLVYKNPLLATPEGPRWEQIWTAAYERVYIPLTLSCLAVEAKLGSLLFNDGDGFNPRVFRVCGIALHMACVLLAFALLRQLMRNEFAAAVGAALFAVHPLQVEAVAWISETKGLLSSFWGLLSLVAYCRFVSQRLEQSQESSQVSASLTPSSRWMYLGAVVAFAFALLAKSSTVSIVLVAAILDYGWYRRSALVVARSLLLWVVLAIVAATVATSAQAMSSEESPAILARVPLAAHSLAWYLRNLVFPLGLSPVYDSRMDDVLHSRWIAWAWVVPVATAVALGLLPHRRVWLVALSLFVAVPLPLLGLVPFDFQRISTVADRYTYLAMLGPAIAIAYLATLIPRRIAIPSAAVLILVLALLSRSQCKHWEDDRAVFTRATQIAPHSAYAWNNLGTDAFRRQQLAEAQRYYARSVELDPEYALAHSNLGSTLASQGNMQAAIQEFRRSLELNPEQHDTQLNLARALAGAGEFDAAETAYRDVLPHVPEPRDLYREFGVSLLSTSQFPRAEAWYREAVQKYPQWPHAYANLSVSLGSQGKLPEAESAALEALRLDPNMADAQQNLKLIRQRMDNQ